MNSKKNHKLPITKRAQDLNREQLTWFWKPHHFSLDHKRSSCHGPHFTLSLFFLPFLLLTLFAFLLSLVCFHVPCSASFHRCHHEHEGLCSQMFWCCHGPLLRMFRCFNLTYSVFINTHVRCLDESIQHILPF